MTDSMPISKARDALTLLPDRLSKESGALTITRRGQPVLAILPWELYDALLETLEVMSDQDLMRDLRASMRELESGETIPWEQVREELIGSDDEHAL